MSKLPLKGIIYLKCSPELCLKRVKNRGRKGEENLDLEYLRKVHEKHEIWIKRQRRVAVLTINTGIYDLENWYDQQ